MLSERDVILAVTEGVRMFARFHSRGPDQSADFHQEGLIKAMKAYRHYRERYEQGHFTDETITKVCASSAKNAILTKQRESVRYSSRFTTADEFVFGNVMSEIDDTEFELLLQEVLPHLSCFEQKVLNERVNPSKSTFDHAVKISRTPETSIKVTGVSIAFSLGVSKATISRSLSEIQRKVTSLFEIEVVLPEEDQ
jgi:RNA polymerase sigma factor (sigma-70 family)